MPTKIPEDFAVSDRVRNWSEKKYGYPDLPAQFLSEFRSHFIAKGTQYDLWDRALMNWIDKASPAGRYYDADAWEAALNKCKAIMKKQPPVLDIPVKRFSIGSMNRPLGKPPDDLHILRQKLAEEVIIAEREKRKVTDTMPDDEEAAQRQAFIVNRT